MCPLTTAITHNATLVPLHRFFTYSARVLYWARVTFDIPRGQQQGDDNCCWPMNPVQPSGMNPVHTLCLSLWPFPVDNNYPIAINNAWEANLTFSGDSPVTVVIDGSWWWGASSCKMMSHTHIHVSRKRITIAIVLVSSMSRPQWVVFSVQQCM